MDEVGLFREDARVGLTGGRIVEMSPIHWPHAGCVNRLTKMLVRLIGDRYDFESPDGILTPDGPAQAPKADEVLDKGRLSVQVRPRGPGAGIGGARARVFGRVRERHGDPG